MTHYPRLTIQQLKCAVYLWGCGRHTHEICTKLHVTEAAVANSLSHWREAQRSIEERHSRDDAAASRETVA